MSIEFYKGMHEAQIKRNEHFTNECRLTISVVVILGSAFGYIMPNLSFDFKAINFFTFINAFFIVGGLFYVRSLDYLIRAFLSPCLIDLAPADKWREHEIDLKIKFKNNKHILVSDKFDEDLADSYIETATDNQKVNDQIGSALRKSTKFVFLAFLFVLPSLFFSQVLPKAEAQTIQTEECIHVH